MRKELFDTTVFSPANMARLPMPTWNWLGVNEQRGLDVLPTEATVFIVAEDGARKEELLVNRGEETRQNVEVSVEKNGTLDLIVVNIGERNVDTIKAVVAEDARLNITVVETGRSDASSIAVDLVGARAAVNLYAVYFADGEDKIDLNYRIVLRGEKTSADMTVKGALSGNGDKIFRGALDFLRGAKGAIGRENEDVVVLSDTVRNRSVPLMLSHEDDVDGHHGVSIGKIDENKIFYLTSRGLSVEEANRLIIEAAAAPVLNRLKSHENLVSEIRSALGLEMSE